jgi:RimJ/RimL family protein N-acetyltransferase
MTAPVDGGSLGERPLAAGLSAAGPSADNAPSIRPARLCDAGEFGTYVVEHVGESGREGSPIFALSRSVSRDDIRTRSLERWIRDINEPLWGRAWLMWAEEPRRVVGHIELVGGRVPAELHRAVLGMGMLRAYTGKGNGARLIETAVAWARSDAKLLWVDLGVFANNTPARKLYTRMGFVELGFRRDAFRLLEGVSIDDVQMTLKL